MRLFSKHFFTAILSTTAAFSSFAQDWILDKNINLTYQEVLIKDQANLASLDMPGQTVAGFEKIFGSSQLNGQNIANWINQRVKVVLDEKFDIQNNISIEGQVVSSNNEVKTKQEGMVVMSNIGAALYMQAKQYGVLIALMVEDSFNVEKILINSPRAGILMIGKGLFYGLEKEEELNKYVNSLLRISTFAHEGRHSDGHGANLSFGHNKCPQGHPMANEYACDFNGNGPYAVGGILSWEMAKNCPADKCTEKDKLRLKADALDSFSRIMKVNGKLHFHDPAHEEIKI
jgi:hypothetical protein